MSVAEAKRFATALYENKELLAEVRPQATGLASIVEIAKSHGYDFSLGEAKEYIRSRSVSELTDQQLDAIAGGKHHGGGSGVATATKVVTGAVEAVVTATSVATTNQIATNTAAASEVAVVIAAVVV